MLFHRGVHTKVSLEPFGVVVVDEILNHSNQAGFIGESYSVISFTLQDAP